MTKKTISKAVKQNRERQARTRVRRAKAYDLAKQLFLADVEEERIVDWDKFDDWLAQVTSS